MIPKLMTTLIVLIMIGLCFSPLNFGAFYILFRPLVQPYATEHYTLFSGIPLTGIFAVVLIVFSVFSCIIRRGYTISAPNIIPLYAFLFFSATSFLNTIDYGVSIAHVLKIATGVSLYILLYSAIQTTADANKVLYSLVITSIIPMLFGYFQFFTHTGIGVDGTRINSLFGVCNSYGMFLCVSLFAALMLIFQEDNRFKRIFLMCTIASIVVSSILARNRGSWIALSASLFFSYFGYVKEIRARWFILAGALMTLFFSGMVIDRFMELGETTSWGGSKNTFAGRVEFWKVIISLIPDHPLIGFGIGTANLVTDKFHKIRNVPHNDYVRLALEVGLPGAILYITFLLRELFNNIRLIYDKQNWFINYPMLAAVIYWIIMSTVQNAIYNVTIFPMFLTLMAVARKWNILTNGETFPRR